jgi:hypothetical protein
VALPLKERARWHGYAVSGQYRSPKIMYVTEVIRRLLVVAVLLAIPAIGVGPAWPAWRQAFIGASDLIASNASMPTTLSVVHRQLNHRPPAAPQSRQAMRKRRVRHDAPRPMRAMGCIRSALHEGRPRYPASLLSASDLGAGRGIGLGLRLDSEPARVPPNRYLTETE